MICCRRIAACSVLKAMTAPESPAEYQYPLGEVVADVFPGIPAQKSRRSESAGPQNQNWSQ